MHAYPSSKDSKLYPISHSISLLIVNYINFLILAQIYILEINLTRSNVLCLLDSWIQIAEILFITFACVCDKYWSVVLT